MLTQEDLSLEAWQEVKKLQDAKGISFDEAIEEIVIEAVARGWLSTLYRPKASVTSINGPPKEVGQRRDKKDTN
jgi:hypothetical protein